jgi:hypothetical protein
LRIPSTTGGNPILKSLDLDAAELGDDEMPEFVNHHNPAKTKQHQQHPQGRRGVIDAPDQRRTQDDHKCHQLATAVVGFLCIKTGFVGVGNFSSVIYILYFERFV